MKVRKINTKKLPGIIERFFGKKPREHQENQFYTDMLPSVNISDGKKEYKMQIALPGFDKKDVNIELKNNCVILTSEKKYENEEKDKNWLRKEYSYSSFRRIFRLPEGTDENKIKAKMKNGVLSLTIGKKKEFVNENKKISVN